MRKLIFTGILLLLCAGPFALAQDNSNPLCSVEDLDFVLGNQDEFDELLAFHRRIPTMDILLEYSAALLEWRKSQAGIVLSCDDAFELGWLMSQMANDTATGAIFNLLEAIDGGNPYSPILHDRHRQRPKWIAELEAIRDSGERVEDYEVGDLRLPFCTLDDFEVTALAVDGYNDLLEVAANVSNIEELAAYGEAQIAWREATWSTMPPCQIPRYHALQMSRVTEDLVVSIGLGLAGVSAHDNPYTESLKQDRQYLADLEIALGERLEQVRRKHGGVRRETAELPICGSDETRAIMDMLRAYQRDLFETPPTYTLDGLLEFAEKQLTWRGDNLAQLPLCSGAILSRILMTQLLSDYLAKSALSLAKVADEESPYRNLPSDSQRIDALALQILGADRRQAPATAPTDLPACSVLEAQRLAEILANFGSLLRISVDDDDSRSAGLLVIADFLAWRAQDLPALPACAEAVELGFLMNEFVSDTTATFALALAGADSDEIPQRQSMSRIYDTFYRRLQEMTS